MATSEPGGRARVARQQRKEALDPALVEAHPGRQLPQDRPELRAKREHALGEEVGERCLDPGELFHMGDVAGALQREDEILRRLATPAAEARERLHRVEGAIDLDRVEDAAGIFQFAVARQAFGIEAPAPRGIEPAGYADSDHAALHGNRPRDRRSHNSCNRCGQPGRAAMGDLADGFSAAGQLKSYIHRGGGAAAQEWPDPRRVLGPRSRQAAQIRAPALPCGCHMFHVKRRNRCQSGPSGGPTRIT